MNKNYILLGLVLLVSCAPNEVPSKSVVERDGIKYEVNSQTPFTGISVSSYKDGQLESKETYKDGKRDGLSYYYHDNGQLEFKVNFKEGELDGAQENYKNGQLHYISNYKDGKQYGTNIFYNSDGKRVADSEPSVIDELHPNGELSYRMHYQSQNDGGQRHGLSEFFDENGQLTQEINYKDGKRDGIYKAYVSGYLHDRRCYKNDEQTDMSYCEK